MPVAAFPATVNAVDEGELTCTVESPDGLELYDVRLRATLDGDNTGIVVLPKVGSSVIVGSLGSGDNDHYVAMWSEVDKVVCLIDGASWTVEADGLVVQKGATKLEVGADGVNIERGGVGLKAALDALIEQIKLLTVTCGAPGSPSSPPINVAAIQAAQTQIDNILA